MGNRSTEEVKREIESERERLGDAVQTLRSNAGSVGKKLSFAALGAAGIGIGTRVFRHRDTGKKKRARRPFLSRD